MTFPELNLLINNFYHFSLTESYEIYTDLVSRLREDKKFKEAAEILKHYLQKSEDAVAVLCEGKEWRNAWKETYCMKRLDLIGELFPIPRNLSGHFYSDIFI